MPLTKEQISEIENTSRSILFAESTADRTITPHVQNIVVEKIIELVTENGTTTFSDKDVRRVSNKLIARNNKFSLLTYTNWKTFNFLVSKLNKKKIIKSPTIEIPNKLRRFQVFKPEEHILRNITYIQALTDYLLRFNDFKEDEASSEKKATNGLSSEEEISQKRGRWRQNLKNKEIEYLFSFISAAAIFGKILSDDYYKWLIQLNPDNIHLKPCYLNRTFPNSNAIKRYFLPAPAAVYLMRCMLFYKRTRSKTESIASSLTHYWVANPEEILAKFGNKFKKWTASKLRHLNSDGLTPTDFRTAAIASSQLDLMDGHASHNSYPPFIISIQSDQIESYAYGNLHFPYFIEVTPDRIDYEDRLPFDRRSYEFRKSTVATVTAKITPLRRSLMEPGKHHIKEREKVLAKIRVAFDSHRQSLEPGDLRNLELYISWISHIVLHEEDEFSSMNTYAGEVPSLLYRLIGVGALDQLSSSELIQIIRQTMFEYDTPGIKAALTKFCNYLAVKIGKPFTEINWNSKTLSKEKVKSMKSFVTFDQLNLAISLTRDFYCAHSERLKKRKEAERGGKSKKNTTDDRLEEKFNAALHKAKVIEFAIQLAYYTGMRVSEIMKVRLRHIKNGKFLTIYKTKTDNGKRNVPFYILLPSSVSKNFIAYYQQRKNQVKTLDELLFVQKKGEKWNPSQISRDVARLFSYIGVRNFHFHHLRHTAANIFLLRYVEAYYSDLIPKKAQILKHELFSENKLNMLKFLMNGIGVQREGDDAVDFVLHILARLMGHGGPQVTIQEYVHCSDIIFYLMSLCHENDKTRLTIRQQMDFLQCSYKRIPSDFEKCFEHGEIKLGALLDQLRKFLQVVELKVA